MKVLLVNKFYYLKGGSETYFFALKKALEEAGHQVIVFAMKDELNLPSEYEQYFVEKIDYAGNTSSIAKIKSALNVVYSFEARKKFEKLVKAEKPDIVHLHVFQHQISPSILDICKKYKLPTVCTAHDLKIICLNYRMMHHGRICEDCKDGRLSHCVINRCVKDSFFKSCVNYAEGTVHRLRKSYDVVDYIITPSEFYRRKFIEFGIAEERVRYIPNFLDREIPKRNLTAEQSAKNENGQTKKIAANINSYYLFMGRVSGEKGIMTLLKAVQKTGVELRVLGTGPLDDAVKAYVDENRMSNVKLLGYKSGQELIDVVANSKYVVLPSEWYENGPYSAIEAMQLSRPIIGADIGGIPELIDGNGYLFKSGDVDSLAESLNNAEKATDIEYAAMEKKSYKRYSDRYLKESHMKAVMEVYKAAIKNKQASMDKRPIVPMH